MGVSWTKEQRQVIELRNRNILVSAAAGSGKTAVLVERIITRLTKDVPPVDIDKLLVVTYTEAAAAEMKERIRDAIEKKLEETPENVHLQRQATLVHNAQITTIHSFCLSVIREHFHVIDLDPGFRIAEEGELRLLKHDVVREVLETAYEEGSKEFLEFVECLATGKDDKGIEELLLQLFGFSRSYPEPEKWLLECARDYVVADLAEMEETKAVKLAMWRTQQYVMDGIALLREGLKVCDDAEGPYMYAKTLEGDMQIMEHLHEAGNFMEMYDTISRIKWEKLASNKDKAVSVRKAEFVKSVRAEVKKTVTDLCGQYFFQEPEELLQDMRNCCETITVLTGLVQEFSERLGVRKQEKNLIDFGDMEQFALQILTTEEGQGRVPSAIAKEYQTMYEEVMIDEYQDSNLIQEAILTSVSGVGDGTYNVFMVGDVKQSIYRFRLSRPELFMAKFDTYSLSDSDKQRIDLHKNFRSRREVLDCTNFLFEQIMTKPLGGITYDSQAALYVGADYQEQPGNETEVVLINTDLDEGNENDIDATGRELEARVIASQIKELTRSHLILDKRTGGYRLAQYRDIVILTRSLKGWGDVFAQTLGREGIPAFTGTKAGYFGTQEIGVILNYLRILDNQKQDLPLAAVMTSPIGGFTSDELAEVRSSVPKLPFHEAVLQYALEGSLAAVSDKIKNFLDQAAYFKQMVPYTAIHELLYRVLKETGYGEYARAMPGGEQRKANLDMLVEKAKVFESTSYKGLFNFIRYMEQLQKYDVDYGEANIANEQADTVRIMSIHKSKGLEFPIVFVAGMSKRFNTQDGTGSILVHPELGIGIDAIDLHRRTKAPTFLKKVIQQEVLNENMGEELRVLYVAMTRAKEKMIMTGIVKNLPQKLQSYESVRLQDEKELTFTRLTKAHTYYDWVLPALIRHHSFADILDKYEIAVPNMHPIYQEEVPIVCREVLMEEIVIGEILKEADSFLTRVQLEQWDTQKVYDEGMRKQLEEQFAYEYPYKTEQGLKLKFTVSELKKRKYQEEEAGEIYYEKVDVIPLLPKFLQEETELKGAGRGTAYHKLLELHDFAVSYDEKTLEEAINGFQAAGKLSVQMGQCIQTDDVLRFLHTKLGQRMQKAAAANQLYKEQPFVLGVGAKEMYPDENSGETVLIQGIIDAYFEEDGELVVLDYKTDKVKNAPLLREKYHRQLEYYAQALEQLTGKSVKEKVIYSFALEEEVQV